MSDGAGTHRAKVGLPPGSVVHVGAQRTDPVRLTVIRYDADRLEEFDPQTVEQCVPPPGAAGVSWINIEGVHRVDIIEAFGRHFGLHPLVLEDIANTTQRPKAEEYNGTLFVVAKMLSWEPRASAICVEQVSFILTERVLLTFQEAPGDVFDLIRTHLRTNRGQLRRMGADYLLYALLDAIVDSYFVVLEAVGDRIEQVHDVQLGRPRPDTPRLVNDLKRQMLELRRAAWPMRDLVAALTRDGNKLLSPSIAPYLRDLYDHSVRVIDTGEIYRDMLSGVLDLHLASISHRMNEVMKVLTIIATIFIPLTFFAGVYGMNFRAFPELYWRWSYPLWWAGMLTIAVGMLAYFRHRRWL